MKIPKTRESEQVPLSILVHGVMLNEYEKFCLAKRPLKFGEYQYFKYLLPPRLDRVEKLLNDPDPFWSWYAALVLELAKELETIEVLPLKKTKGRTSL